MKKIHIKGLATRYKCFLDNNNNLVIFNEKGQKLGTKYHYNSQQTNYCLRCEDGKRRSFYALRLMYAYTNDISVLDIPKGCILKTRYGLEFYNKPQILQRPLKCEPLGEDKLKYLDELDKWWNFIRECIVKSDVNEIGEKLYELKPKVLKRVRYTIGLQRDVLEDCFNEAVTYFLERIISPRKKMMISLPEDALCQYMIKIYKTQYKNKRYENDYYFSQQPHS